MSSGLQFKVAGQDTWYEVWTVTPREAIERGCPGATYRLIGPRTGTETYGTFERLPRVPLRTVKVPGTNLVGAHRGFLAWGNGLCVLLEGYLVNHSRQ